MRFSVVLLKKLFLSFLILCSCSFKAKAKTCIDFSRDGIVPLILLLQGEIDEALAEINIKINLGNISIVDAMSDVIWESTVSITDALTEDGDFVQGQIEGSTLSIIDTINLVSDLGQLIKDRNLSKSGNIPRCSPDGPFEITESGYYALEGNTNCCIVIKVSDVTIDLNDFTLFCTTDDVIKTDPSLKNIEIKNGKIKSNGIQNGIFVDHSCELITVKNVTVFDCNRGVFFSGTGASEIKDGIVKDCDFVDCSIGFQLVHARKSMLQDCNAFGCTSLGFYADYCNFCIFDSCTALGTQGTAFSTSSGNGNLFSRCAALDTTSAGVAVGFYATSEVNTKIVNCVVNRTISPLSFGIYLLNCTGCIVEGNESLNANNRGIREFPGGDNLFARNISYNNTLGNYSGGIINVYVYDHDSGPATGRDPKLLDNLDIVGP